MAIALLAGFAGTAVAAPRCEAAPGTSGTDQYCETVPGANGDRGSGTGPGTGRSLDRKTAKSLGREGRDGRGVLALPSSGRRVEFRSEPSTSPSGASGKRAREQGGSRSEREQGGSRSESSKIRSESSKSTLGAIGSAIASGPSAGQSFLWVLAAAAVGMVGIAWTRYRRGSKKPSD